MNKRNIIILGSSIIIVLVLLLLILWLLSIFGHRHLTYEQVESKMVNATEKFYKEHPEILPTVDGKSTLSYNVLVENGYIDPLNKLLQDGDSCSAETVVIKDGNNYNYIPKLTCADKYATKSLYEQVFANNDVVTSGSGLYRDENGEYYFKGKNLNNYVSLGVNTSKKDTALLWQILSIKDNQIKIRATFKSERTPFDTRYNEDKKYESGYNTFDNSTIKDFLTNLDKNSTFLSSEQRNILVRQNLCIGARSLSESSKDGSVECSTVTNEKYLFGLAAPYEYMRASLDDNCNVTDSKSCENLNFLIDEENYTSTWTLTANSENTHEVLYFDGIQIQPSSARNNKTLLLTATISEYALYRSGDGSLENPYKLFK